MKLDKSSDTNNVELRIVACVVSKCALERHTPGRYCVFDFEVKISPPVIGIKTIVLPGRTRKG